MVRGKFGTSTSNQGSERTLCWILSVDQIKAKVNQKLPGMVSDLEEGLSFGGFEHGLIGLIQGVVGIRVRC